MSYHDAIMELVAPGEEVTTSGMKERLRTAGLNTTKVNHYLNSEVKYGFFEKLGDAVRSREGAVWRRIA